MGTAAIAVVRRLIFSQAKNALDLETMHWYMALDDCFENDELQTDMLGALKWRCQVLNMKGQDIRLLTRRIDDVVIAAGYDLNAVGTGV